MKNDAMKMTRATKLTVITLFTLAGAIYGGFILLAVMGLA